MSASPIPPREDAMPAVPADADRSAALRGESYLDIVWRQFRKNRAALWSLWVFAALFLVAIFAPCIASNQPLVFYDGDQTIYPWFRALFNQEQAVDYLFNMALVAFVPWSVVALVGNSIWKRRGMGGRQRLSLVLVGFVAATAVAAASRPFHPLNRYAQRSFAEEELVSRSAKQGRYVPIPFGPTEQDLDVRNQRPLFRKDPARWKEANDGFVHVFGTDGTGRDVLVRIIYGTRISMTVGFVAVSIYITIGVMVGALAGYFGGWLDITISRIIEIVLLFPSFFLILTLVALLGRSIYIIMVVIGITGWPTIARLTRGEVLKQRQLDYVVAARALGAPNLRVIFRHILPNALAPALVAAPFGIAGAIITEAGLSLLGFGVRPPAPSWGMLLREGNDNYHYWWLVLIPSVAIFVTVTVFNVVGSGLRDAMDPRLRM
jgi:peptide/nickel transport system permease protein